MWRNQPPLFRSPLQSTGGRLHSTAFVATPRGWVWCSGNAMAMARHTPLFQPPTFDLRHVQTRTFAALLLSCSR